MFLNLPTSEGMDIKALYCISNICSDTSSPISVGAAVIPICMLSRNSEVSRPIVVGSVGNVLMLG